MSAGAVYVPLDARPVLPTGGRARWSRADRRRWGMSYPRDGVVLQGHADYCALFGHAYGVRARGVGELGELDERCARCRVWLRADELAPMREYLIGIGSIGAELPPTVEAARVQLECVLVSGIEAAYAAAPDELGAACSPEGGSHGSLVSAASVGERLRAGFPGSPRSGSARELVADATGGALWFGWLDALEPLAGELPAGTDLAEWVAALLWRAASAGALDSLDTGGELVQWIARGDRRVLDYLPRSIAVQCARTLADAVTRAAWELATVPAARAVLA